MSIHQMRKMSAGIQLKDILPDAKFIGNSKFVVHSACGKWDECQAGDVFVAVADSDGDGHDFATEAIGRGAVAVVGERMLAISTPQFIVEDSRTAYGEICQALAGTPSRRLSTIGVTGTAGKTVTSHLIHNILEKAGLATGLSSSIETRIGCQSELPQPTMTSPVVAQQLSQMAVGNCSHAVIETSSIALAQHALSGISLDAAVLTNIGNNHLDFHGNCENYRRAKTRLLDYLKPTGFAVVNADEKQTPCLLDELTVPALTFGIHRNAEVTAKLLDRNASFQTFMLTAGIESIAVQTATIGKQHIYNCLAAAAVGLTLGISLEVIAQGLETAKTPGRLERLDCGQEFGVWIDSALSPSHLNGALAAVAPVCDGKLWCICSTDNSQTPEDRKRLGQLLERKTEKPIITQSRATAHINYEPSHQIIDGFENPGKAHVMPDRIKAIQWALSQAKTEDVVLISGAGEKPIAVLEENDQTVTDRDICQAYLFDNSKGVESEIYRMDDYC